MTFLCVSVGQLGTPGFNIIHCICSISNKWLARNTVGSLTSIFSKLTEEYVSTISSKNIAATWYSCEDYALGLEHSRHQFIILWLMLKRLAALSWIMYFFSCSWYGFRSYLQCSFRFFIVTILHSIGLWHFQISRSSSFQWAAMYSVWIWHVLLLSTFQVLMESSCTKDYIPSSPDIAVRHIASCYACVKHRKLLQSASCLAFILFLKETL